MKEKVNKDLRIAAGLLQIDVAKELDVDQGAVSHWESGRHLPAKKHRKKLAKLYGCSEEELIVTDEVAL